MVALMSPERQLSLDRVFETEGPVVRASVLQTYRFCSKDVAELVADGYISKLRTGYYIKTTTLGKLEEIELVSLLVPQGVISLLSAAHFHNMTTVNPTVISITLPRDARIPVLPRHPPIRVYKTLPELFGIGIDNVQAPNCVIRIYNRERTVCDIFRMRFKFGEDVALEVLKSYIAGAKAFQELFEYADAMHIKDVIRPYIEALV